MVHHLLPKKADIDASRFFKIHTVDLFQNTFGQT